MIRDIEKSKDLDKVLKQLPGGAFLTVKNDNEVNTMTIGWANFGIVWGKPILMVAVRKSRYTHKLISKAQDYAVSVPVEIDLDKELDYCGTHSGRNENKIKKCKLHLTESKSILSPIVKECDYHYECKIVYSQFMDQSALDSSIKDQYYADDDYHVLYFGEIVESYKYDE